MTYSDRVLTLCDRHTFSLANTMAAYLDGQMTAARAKDYARKFGFDKCAGPGKDCTLGRV